ncbi:MAG: ribosomal protein L3 N(5)-glutamine methyltransferase [gamma proteobacterium symbiont of Ctena orbiculata]|uniref:Ribosomal protein uL3 glutamine methyltransferase n=1 Tax=Candidatus Thiodiazotropha taylori TaxID=2792791 RepID=A0A944MAW6_9GAMM|nr:50S ribosomal protein L3 N(5)-glutamine methyltransferase [Candidatus Thiodiazotropha taylori]PVV11870.1 MAG: ribosomal protein L3 N(5)-glutamine methyltransferase [gamma proteobacterium symbiont of Ctena orbiculata]MBT2989379.1 50S ribosomal protein L3 N(5)-glutamine methyltransferase [Candidatus Thiodiazotropha taylori]MBT2996959.1 50S ribosomal protein L3 N(5)-glutamine methyltransferase [Candidatus Thiodiazotropha taylori]MBT3000814.1 50S ribosomal protein L3 N(5)-glutamine methyltransfe
MQTLTTIADFIRWGASRFAEARLFFGHGTDNALDEAVALVLGALHLPPDLPAGWFGSRLTAAERQRVSDLITRRIEERIPLPYLLGEAWFAGMRFHVNERVLIPRSPIAELIERGYSPWLEPAAPQILDLCCGSGCIGIATAAYLPDSQVDLVDISTDVLVVAQQNVAEYGLQERVAIHRSDLLEDLPPKQYDLIVSNPPYVGEAEMEELPEEYRHEPVLALQANENGLEIVQRILQQAGRYLTPQGILIVEVGNSAELVVDRYPRLPFVWLDFERGGEGVFLLTAADLAE